eukprot:TRINITY_DN12598_c0_g1::TRINITY_DN12598_c0_g1_i1::g.2715::m.2715 TRINITY_DN12598_c0_g1::TRINITY_DN12598_c0_g1_i1::g.2715  ORF type:complete len:444 (+),score=95.73,sp/Q9M8Y0/SEC_ARATH/34.52/1e-64,Glyco_transf_41/PF13844.1/3.6e-38,Glyco_transf_41/PF13844.1/1.7e-32 TRINITY_DN12598_c0_g1_i1:3-1334(+)
MNRPGGVVRKVDVGFFLIMEQEIDGHEELRISRHIATDVIKEGMNLDVTVHPAREWARGGRVRIGYVSYDLYPTHPVGHLMRGVLRLHDRKKFKVYCYILLSRPSDGDVTNHCDVRVDMTGWTPQQMATRMTSDRLDVAVDLNGFTHGGRPELFARRVAPIQVQYMGYLGTMGMDTMDYVLTDRVTSPPEAQSHYAEKLMYTPHSFLVNDMAYAYPQAGRNMHTEERDELRQSLGLPALQDSPLEDIPKGMVFGAFNSLTKIEPDVFQLWCDLLHTHPDSKLWFVYRFERARENLILEARARGVPEHRLLFSLATNKEQFLRMVKGADVFLDAPSRSAGATAADVLWAGVPMLTLPGDKMTNRLPAAMALALHARDMIVSGMKEYEDVASEMSTPPAPGHVSSLLSVLRDRMWHRADAPFFDTKMWVADYETQIENALIHSAS